MSNLPALIVSSEAELLGSDRLLRKQFAAGVFTRVAHGVYMRRAEWSRLDADEQHRALVRASALRSKPGAQFSHDSAAAMYRLPSIGPWPNRVHELVAPAAGGTSRRGILRHSLGIDPNGTEIDGVTVSSLERTLVDVACTSSFVRAVAMIDHALRPEREGEPRWGLGIPLVSKVELLRLTAELAPYRGIVRGRRAVEFADGGAGSPAESFGRVQFHALKLPPPELQVPFFDAQGLIGYADFYWRELDLVVEIDGKAKYGPNRHFQKGVPVDELLWQEKQREDRLRRVMRSFERLDWETIADRRELAARLARHGLRRG
ncbi:hypothetical protein [Conyzicola sp.]|uniref:hypothetical protein n=1 Tax=Conyzicola sp. TaxID=1969404 RepID=UPI0039896F5A